MTGSVSCEIQSGLAIVTFENAARLNAIDIAIARGLAETVARLAHTDYVNAILIRGAGTKAFSSGVDLKAADATGDRAAAFAEIDKAMQRLERDFKSMCVPTIAQINGICYGGGVHIASLAEFRVGSVDTRVSIPAIANRLIYPTGALQRLGDIIGWQHAKALLYGGEPIGAEHLQRWGFLDSIYPSDAIDRAAVLLGERMAAQPRQIMQDYRRIFDALERRDQQAAEQIRAEAQARNRGSS